MIFKKLIEALNRNTDALTRNTEALSPVPEMATLADEFRKYLTVSNEFDHGRGDNVKRILDEVGSKTIAEVSFASRALALRLLRNLPDYD